MAMVAREDLDFQVLETLLQMQLCLLYSCVSRQLNFLQSFPHLPECPLHLHFPNQFIQVSSQFSWSSFSLRGYCFIYEQSSSLWGASWHSQWRSFMTFKDPDSFLRAGNFVTILLLEFYSCCFIYKFDPLTITQFSYRINSIYFYKSFTDSQ